MIFSPNWPRSWRSQATTHPYATPRSFFFLSSLSAQADAVPLRKRQESQESWLVLCWMVTPPDPHDNRPLSDMTEGRKAAKMGQSAVVQEHQGNCLTRPIVSPGFPVIDTSITSAVCAWLSPPQLDHNFYCLNDVLVLINVFFLLHRNAITSHQRGWYHRAQRTIPRKISS